MEITSSPDDHSQPQSRSSEMELTNMSPVEESSSLTVVPMSVSTGRNNDTEKGTKEEIQPLAASVAVVAAAARSNDSIPPNIPKNRRRPGSSCDGSKVTMTGTVLQGSSGGQPVEVEVELSEREFQRLTSRESRKQKRESCTCGTRQGPHILILSFLCIPVAFVISWCLSFYNGSITWYNLFIYFSEEKSIVHRLTLCPLLILSFPFTVGLSSVIISVVASFMQISWSWIRWKGEILDGEKGFYGWLCHKMQLPDCSPYQVVILEDNMAF